MAPTSSKPTPSPAPTPGRKPPFQLRTSSSTRKASNPTLSLVYASSGSSLPPPPASTSSTSRSEEALSRQLDGDLGGKQMGLRSRRSSTATLRTINTINGAAGGPQSPRESIAEVEEEDEHENHSGAVEMGTRQDERRTRLNPKASNSWLRWNSPTPSFPKGKGKGKEVAEGHTGPGRRASTIGDDKVDSRDGENTSTAAVKESQGAGASTDELYTAGDTIKASSVGLVAVPGPTESKAGGWFTKNPPPTSKPDSSTADLEVQSAPLSDPISSPEHQEDATPQNQGAQDTGNSDKKIGDETSKGDQVETDSPVGWKEYLTWGRKGTPRPRVPTATEAPSTSQSGPDPPILTKSEVVKSADHPSATDSSVMRPEDGEQITHSSAANDNTKRSDEQAEVTIQQTVVPEPELVDKNTSPKSIINTTPRQTWGSFLYGIVIPQVGNVPSESTANGDLETSEVVVPTSATTEQPPVHLEVDPTTEIEDQVIEDPSRISIEAPESVEDSTLKPPSGTTVQRRSSQASTTGGWLNYLAFRASQKKVEKAASSIATEEVMDLSNDPNFPADPLPLPVPVNKSMPPPSGLPDKKKKRLSTSSIKSSTSIIPIPPSPQNQSKVGTAASTPAPSQKISALPPPPQIPTTQPNLVIPSFSTTFDRPPRSLLPPKPASPAPAPQPGLAWRALGAVGSYVYPGQEKIETKVQIPGPQETRGLEEGREIGLDLPRRIGLSGEDPDDGWKNVKRVVVVGVHGWFPAKIVNSVIGEPTGTSSKFANMMGQAVKKFFDDKGIDDIRLTLIPLEGEGTIEHRVDR